MWKSIATIVLISAALGCGSAGAKYPNRAAVVMKISETEGYVCMGAGEVEAGDRVALYRNDCARPSLPKSKSSLPKFQCDKVKIGEGRVTKTLNEHYSVVQVEPGVHFEEGTTVEKLR